VAASEIPSGSDLKGPYREEEDDIINSKFQGKDEYIPRLHNLDNGNVVIIFDNSRSGSIEDTLIAARLAWESRWRRLPLYLALESREPIDNDEQLALQCSNAILSDVFKAVVTTWDRFLARATAHVRLLEDKIHEQPADEACAPELWTCSSSWLRAEKLLNVHTDVMNEMRNRLHELTGTYPAKRRAAKSRS
jgi:hypothetical protein